MRVVWNEENVGKMVTATLAVGSWAATHSLEQLPLEMPNGDQVLPDRCQMANRSACLDAEILGLGAALAGLCLPAFGIRRLCEDWKWLSLVLPQEIPLLWSSLFGSSCIASPQPLGSKREAPEREGGRMGGCMWKQSLFLVGVGGCWVCPHSNTS